MHENPDRTRQENLAILDGAVGERARAARRGNIAITLWVIGVAALLGACCVGGAVLILTNKAGC